jgi:hypothetical protein
VWFGAHAVARFDLVGVRDGLAGKRACVCVEADHLVVQPAVFNLVEQGGCIDGEHLRIDRLLGVDVGREFGRAVVRVDDAVDVAAEPKPEQEVALDDGPAHGQQANGVTNDTRGGAGSPGPPPA